MTEGSGAFDVSRVRAGLAGAASGWPIHFYPSVGSTMDVARELAAAGAETGTVVVADEQTAGRGRLGRAWHSRPGGNLYFTVVLRPSAFVVARLPMIVPLAVAEAIEQRTGLPATIKWPNDVQLNGLKCCGVLIDSQMNGAEFLALVGIGINVNRDPRENPELRDIATCISAELGQEVEREGLLAIVLTRLAELYELAGRRGDVRSLWRSRLNTLGRAIRVRSGEQVYEGTAEDVDEDGSLCLRQADGSLLTLNAGEVTLRA